MSNNYNNMNYWANQWRNIGGVNVIPVDSKTKIPKVEYKHLKDKPILDELHNYWIKMNMFKDGIDIINGPVWHNKYKKNLFLHTIDLDNELAIKEVTNIKGVHYTLEDLSKRGVIIEQHLDDKTRAHILVYSEEPFPNLAAIATADNTLPRIEVKGIGKLTTVTPSIHANGSNYEFIGDGLNSLESPVIHTEFMYHVNDILKKYGIEYLSGKGNKNAARIPIKNDEKVYEGARHDFLINRANLIYGNNMNILPSDILEQTLLNYNIKRCSPPLPEQEVKQICKDVYEHQLSKLDSANGKGDGNGETKKETKDKDPQLEVLNEKITKQDIDFVIETMTKEAKHDEISIKQLFYGMFSGFTKTAIHSNVNSKNAGAGKSYLLILVSDYFPNKYVLTLVGASDKAFQHKEGIMVLEEKETGELTEVEPIISKLRIEILDIENEIETEKAKVKKDKNLVRQLKNQVSETQKEINSILEHQQKLIDLNNTIILLLDTPQDAVTDGLMSLLSNDTTRDQKYLFTDKSASGKLGSKYNILRGVPVMFTTRVIDDTRSSRFEEKNRRFINITPNVTSEKIQDANSLIAKKYGLTAEEYDESVVSKEDKERARGIVSIIVEKLKNHSKYLKPKDSGIKIPFIGSISVPNNDVWSMTVTDRMMRYLTIITKVNMDGRPRLVRKDNRSIFLPISTFEDLRQTLDLMERGGSNVRPYIAEWYNKVFLPTFNAEDGIKTDDEKNLREHYVSISSSQLREKTKEILHITIGSDELRQKYTDPLVHQGLIEKVKSEIKKSENIYLPVDSKGENIFSLFSDDDLRLHVEYPNLYPCKQLIQDSFKPVKCREKHRDKDGGILEKNILDIYRLEDADGTEITPEQLAERYFSCPETCFIKGYLLEDRDLTRYSSFNSEIFGCMIYLGRIKE